MRRLALLLGVWLSFHTGAAQARDFDYYILSLSWSPAYCLLHAGDRDQCTKGYGFVLHGLWPQYEKGGYPEHCQSAEPLSEAARKLGAMTYPSPFLAVHEWNAHGRCTPLSALQYFRAADKAFTQVHIPPAFEAPAESRRLSTAAILAAFQSVNKSWPKDSAVVTCKNDALAELRLCLDKTLTPRPCGRHVVGQCRGTVAILPIR